MRIKKSPRQVQRYITQLEKAGHIARIKRFSGRKAQTSNGYSFEGIIRKLKALEPQWIEAVAREDLRRHEAEDEGVMQAAIGATTNPDRTLGFRYREMHLPLDVEIYVLGVVGEDHCIGAPQEGAKGQRFLISVNSEEARTAELGSKSKWMLGIGVACLIGAVASLGSAAWLARHGLTGAAPPQEVLQNESWW